MSLEKLAQFSDYPQAAPHRGSLTGGPSHQ